MEGQQEKKVKKSTEARKKSRGKRVPPGNIKIVSAEEEEF